MEIRELSSVEEMCSVYPIMAQMYDNMSSKQYEDLIKSRHGSGYRMLGVYEDGKCIAAAGFWIGIRFYCGKFIQIDNLVTDTQYRSKGVGGKILNWVKKLGKKEGCKRVLLDSYVENFDAHQFFYREGFIIRGYHFNCDI